MDLFNMLDAMDETPIEREHNPIRAPFGYPGGKDRSIKHLMKLLPVRDIWVDVCGGSGIVTLNRKRSKILDVYNDRWSGVTAFFQCLRDDNLYQQLYDKIALTMHSREDFIFCKSNWTNENFDTVTRAALFHAMLSYSFSGLGRNWARTLKSRVTFKETFDIPYWEMIHERFKECQIENLDWELCLKDFDGIGTVFYIDPPYLGTFPAIYKHKFTEATHRKMLDKIFNDVEGYVAVSSYVNPLYEEYPWDEKWEWKVSVSINSRSSTETGHRMYDGHISDAVECLYVKETKL